MHFNCACTMCHTCKLQISLILQSRDDPPAVYLSCSLSQSPAFSWGRSELTDRNVELYPQFFLELITTQLRFYMVSPQLSLLIILAMQSYKFYLYMYLMYNTCILTQRVYKQFYHSFTNVVHFLLNLQVSCSCTRGKQAWYHCRVFQKQGAWLR